MRAKPDEALTLRKGSFGLTVALPRRFEPSSHSQANFDARWSQPILVQVFEGSESPLNLTGRTTASGFLSGQVSNKMGLKLESEKVDGERRYRLG